MTDFNIQMKEPEILNHPSSEMIFIQKNNLEIKLNDFKNNLVEEFGFKFQIGDLLGYVALVFLPFTSNFESIGYFSSQNVRSLYFAIAIICTIVLLIKAINFFNYKKSLKGNSKKITDHKEFTKLIRDECEGVLPLNSKKIIKRN